MADKIKFSGSQLGAWAKAMGSVSAAFAESKSILDGVNTSGTWWSRFHAQGDLKLTDTNQNVHFSGRDSIKQLSGTLGTYEKRTSTLKSNMTKAKLLLDLTELQVTANFAGGLIGSLFDLFEKLGSGVGGSQGTAEVHSPVSGISAVVNEDGSIVIYRSDGSQTTISVSNDGPFGIVNEVKVETDNGYEHEEYSVSLEHQEGYEGKLDMPDKIKDLKKKYDSPIHDDTLSERKETWLETGITFASSTSAIALEGKIEGKYGEGKASLDVLKHETELSFKGGVYQTEVTDANGNKRMVTEVGVSAKAGESFTVLDAKASGKLGNDWADVHGDVGVTVGKVSGEVEAQFGLVDGKPVARLSGSAEAIAAEAKGTVGVSVAGVKGDVTGTVNVGIGAHADFAIEGGRIKADIGASLGIGVSVKVDLDVSGAINNATKAAANVATNVAKGASSAAKAIGKGLSKLKFW